MKWKPVKFPFTDFAFVKMIIEDSSIFWILELLLNLGLLCCLDGFHGIVWTEMPNSAKALYLHASRWDSGVECKTTLLFIAQLQPAEELKLFSDLKRSYITILFMCMITFPIISWSRKTDPWDPATLSDRSTKFEEKQEAQPWTLWQSLFDQSDVWYDYSMHIPICILQWKDWMYWYWAEWIYLLNAV